MKTLKKIIILGGGTSGWMSAAILSNQLKKEHCKIELVESELLGTIGVGESTVPPFMSLLASLGIDELDFIGKCNASFKLGIQFEDWYKKGSSFFHPFGKISAGFDEHSLYQYWLRGALAGERLAFMDLSPCGVLAKHKRFVHHSGVAQSVLAESRHALHLDAALAAQYLRNYAEGKGVVRREGKVHEVLSEGSDKITGLVLENGKKIEGDFFIDCSGFNALLIGKTLKVDYVDWSHYLPCDRAVTAISEKLEDTPPYTKASAKEEGWIWRIPLQNRTGNGYVFVSEQCSDDRAWEKLSSAIKGEVLNEPRIIPFRTGIRKQFWKGNCICIGLSAGFIEPLESTAIHLAMRGAAEFIQQFPRQQSNEALINEYNKKITRDYQEIRDFIILHYSATQREDSPLWQYCRNMELPDSLVETLEYFKAQGEVPQTLNPLFEGASWRSICEGMGIRPKYHSTLIEAMDYKTVKQHMSSYKKHLNEMVLQSPTHDAFIQKFCSTKAPPK